MTCGSVLKIKNSKYDHRLHSHEVKYGSGSGQQSVTAVDTSDDHNSYWQIRPRNGALQCVRGYAYFPFASGAQVALSHKRCLMQFSRQVLLYHSPPAPLHPAPPTQSPVCVATLIEPGGVRIRRGERRRR